MTSAIAADEDWGDEVVQALHRARSPFTFTDWWRWLCTGQLAFAATECMRASVWFRPDGGAEVAHISGQWCDECAQWLHKRMREAALEHGVDFVEINGRRGWMRFLRTHGGMFDGSNRTAI